MKNKIISISFLIVIFGLFLFMLIKPDQDISQSERRRLAQLPTPSVKTVFNREFMGSFDKYATDQFPEREFFRAVKTFVDRNVFLKKDTNKLFQIDGGIFSIEYPLREDKVLQMCEKLTNLYNRYLTGMNIYFSIVPDKNYHLPDNGSYLLMDYDRLEELMKQNIPGDAVYIDLFDVLSIDNYYKSDGHWRQETLKPVIDALNEGMGVASDFDPSQYEQKSHYPFYGAYYGQLAGMADPDTIIRLENDITRDAKITSLGHPDKEYVPMYNIDGLSGIDSYDVFLYGAQPLITMKNPHNTSGRELIIVRDSFGSSLAPLLLESYSSITLIDLRYITQELLADYVTFANQDVLFLFSTIIINNSDIIR